MATMTDELYEEEKKKAGTVTAPVQKETVTSIGTQGTTLQQPETPAAQVKDYSPWLEEMNAARQRSAMAELQAAYDNNMAALNRAERGLAGEYQTARNQTVGDSERSKRNFQEYAAASGLNSGTGGQAELARSVALQNNLNAINAHEADARADLDLQRVNAETEYGNAIAQARAEGDYELAKALYQEKVRMESALNDAASKKYQLDYQAYRDGVGDRQWQQQVDYSKERDAVADSKWQQQFNYGKEQDAADRAYAQKDALADYGWAFLQMGEIPPAAMLEAMDMTGADARVYANAVKAAKAAGSSGGTAAGGGTTPAMNLTTAKQAAAAGYFDDQVLSVLRENGYSDAMLSAIYGYQPPVTVPPVVDSPSDAAHVLADEYATYRAGRDAMREALEPNPGTKPAEQPADYGLSYTTAWSQARKMYDAGRSDGEILAYLDTFSDARLTRDGLAYIMSSLDLGGYRTGVKE